MKIKKTMAAIAAAAMSLSLVSAFAMSASAVKEGDTVLNFEDGACEFVYMNEDDGADHSKISVESYNGSNQLKIDVQDCTKVPKVWFDLDKICPRDTAIQINSVEMDLTFVPKDSSKALGWMGGVLCSAGGFDMNLPGKGQANPSWSQGDWANEDENAYTEGLTATQHVSRKYLLPSTKYSADGINPFFGIMVWANQNGCEYVMYIDNIVLKDKAGNALSLGVPAAAPAEEAAEEAAPVEETAAVVEEAAPAEDTAVEEAAPAEDTAVVEEAAPAVEEAPAAVTTTTPVATGNASVAAIAAVMALAGAAALVSKRK